MEHAKCDLRYLDPETNEKYIPYIVESTYGLDRTVLAILFNSYEKETLENKYITRNHGGKISRIIKIIIAIFVPFNVLFFVLIKIFTLGTYKAQLI